MTMKKIFYVICIVLLLWVAVSFCDVVADNSKPNPVHSNYNFFMLFE